MSVDWLIENFDLLFGLCVGWVAFWVLASAVHRKLKGRGVKSPPKEDIVFEERTASGRSLKSWYTSMGGAQNCLVVTVTGAKLLVRPFFPFTLMFLPEIFDLEHERGLKDLESVKKEKDFLRDKVLISFQASGIHKTIELRLRDADAFIQAAAA